MAQPTPNFTNGYLPTRQESGLWKYVRGNAPGTLSDEKWANAFNAEDCHWRRFWGWDIDEAAAARECGGIRKKAIVRLIDLGFLPAGFTDDNP